MQQPDTEQNILFDYLNPEQVEQIEEQKPKKTYFQTHKDL